MLKMDFPSSDAEKFSVLVKGDYYSCICMALPKYWVRIATYHFIWNSVLWLQA
ncbi:hypothetical protein PAHAL_9G363400 [Panicum hallii]|jgi:hypothetical protein|uniref:Uncharacterized protein n=1 Tax=Panicum hallii TaxID=206008 RepID=A0A2T8I3Q8_9POAL|nr:hypothetical protein PAHAL_9G363400 [Panicum hallii]